MSAGTSANRVVVVGGGPGGALLAYLLARGGIPVTLLESRGDFEREYRGDSLHPYTLELLDQLGLAEGVLAIPHVRADAFRFRTPHGTVVPASYRRLRTPFNYIALMPQARLIEHLLQRAAQYPWFELRTRAKVTDLLTLREGEPDSGVRGVRYRDHDGVHDLEAALVVGADGRNSAVRRHADLPVHSLGATTDLIWFRLSRRDTDPQDADLDLYCGPGRTLGVLGGSDHWRVGFSIPKGGYAAAREAGVGPIRDFVRTHVRWLADRVDELDDFSRTSLLSVDISRARRWYRPGVLLIGDAAHVISPVGGNGILMAVQDAVSATSRLAGPLHDNTLDEMDLAAVQAEREPAITEVQSAQVRTEQALARNREHNRLAGPPRWLTPLFLLPSVQRRGAYGNAYGPRPPRLDVTALDRLRTG